MRVGEVREEEKCQTKKTIWKKRKIHNKKQKTESELQNK